ncbi:pentapeptide repeat-containing protein [Clostridium frigoris]|uniref:Pentapeptide repeat-containing protein n=1 Tax=Clostridium frigoris TaxID=205327 RepID=A0ABS6BQH0_9CLOT|nr:pentapeptide repeat-containing protein [Clostridium frigoris]MBU3159167.1 pentapeptide repeat-containing protein [Clostridium frigoris]
MATNRSVKGNFNYNNIEKTGKNFMYKNLERSNCYNSDFSDSNFNYVNFRGAHFKSCVFLECTFKCAEFIGTNLKDSDFQNTVFENTLFDSTNLDGADFKDAEFKNTIFLLTDVHKAKNLSLKNSEIRIFDEIPELEISDNLRFAILKVMKNKYVKAARVLDTKTGDINIINVMILLENFDEETLIKGLNIVSDDLNCDFHTLSYIIKYIKNNL